MGTDIHLYIEREVNGKWQYYNWEEKYYTGETWDDGEPKINYDMLFEDPLYIGRNYDLFAILANVRNGYGFGGVPTGAGFIPIDNPRGLPVDVTKNVAEQYEESWCHDATWLTLQELLEYDWEQKTISYGVVNEEQYVEFVRTGEIPASYGAAVGGFMVMQVDQGVMDSILRNSEERIEGVTYYTRISWRTTYRDAVGPWWFATMDALKNIVDDPSDLRIIIWFDS